MSVQHRDADYIITHSGKDTEPGKVFRIASKEEEGTGDGKAGKGQIMFSTHTQNTHTYTHTYTHVNRHTPPPPPPPDSDVAKRNPTSSNPLVTYSRRIHKVPRGKKCKHLLTFF